MLKKLSKSKNKDNISKQQNPNVERDPVILNKSLSHNMTLIKDIFKDDDTLILREFENKWLASARCCIFYLEGMVDANIVNENILEPLLSNDLSKQIESDDLLEELRKKVIAVNHVVSENDVNKLVESMIQGDTIFFLDRYDKALIINSKGWKSRSITEPESAKVVRGPREGFTESIMINLSLVRRKIQNPDLKFKFSELGTKTKTKICVCYIKEIALEEIISELDNRLKRIDIDGIIDSGYIQELIRDAPFSPFETVGSSERPDVIAAKLLEGRVALFVDGSPFVLTVPFIIIENTQANEDYYNNFIYSSVNRFIRSTATVMASSIPAVYIALTTFHQEMLPTPLLLSISSSRQGVPFPTSVSMFIMLLIFDILREAGTRMPSPIGQAVNIVGTLVLGQAAVEAKLVSAPVVIITALSGILTLMNPMMIGPIIIYRFFLLLAASVLGIYGYIFGMMLIVLHILSIRSFGVPYLLNLTTITNHNGQDVWIRVPWWEMTLRPKIIAARNLVRQTTKKGRRQSKNDQS